MAPISKLCKAPVFLCPPHSARVASEPAQCTVHKNFFATCNVNKRITKYHPIPGPKSSSRRSGSGQLSGDAASRMSDSRYTIFISVMMPVFGATRQQKGSSLFHGGWSSGSRHAPYQQNELKDNKSISRQAVCEILFKKKNMKRAPSYLLLMTSTSSALIR